MENLKRIREEENERIQIIIDIEPKKKVFCDTYGKYYTKSNISHHFRTQSHNIRKRLNYTFEEK